MAPLLKLLFHSDFVDACAIGLVGVFPDLMNCVINIIIKSCTTISAGNSLLHMGPCVVSRPRHLHQARHALDAVMCLLLPHQFELFCLRCFAAKKAVAFDKNSLSIFASANSRRRRAFSARRSASLSPSEDPWRSRSFFTHRPKRPGPTPISLSYMSEVASFSVVYLGPIGPVTVPLGSRPLLSSSR